MTIRLIVLLESLEDGIIHSTSSANIKIHMKILIIRRTYNPVLEILHNTGDFVLERLQKYPVIGPCTIISKILL